MMFGFAGKLLRVNLSTGEITRKPLSEELARSYLGGRGFAARILYDELEPGITRTWRPTPMRRYCAWRKWSPTC